MSALQLALPALRESIRAKWIIGLGMFVAVVSELLIRFGGGGETTLVSLLELTLLLTPLVALVLATMQLTDARDVVEFLLAQPVARTRVFRVLFATTYLPVTIALVTGLALPFAWHGLLASAGLQLLELVTAVTLLGAIGVALAFVIAFRAADRVRAIAIAMGIWFGAAVVWDGIVLMGAFALGDRIVNPFMLLMLALNPIDLARVTLLLGTDAAALSGATGAVAQHTLGTSAGQIALALLFVVWIVIPLRAALTTFIKKDF
jgi:Cu-processing system permease protein